MQVRELMTPEPITISPTSSLEEAYSLMLINDIHELPVLESGRLIGILTERDILSRVGPSNGENREGLNMSVEDAMTRAVEVLQPDTRLSEACRRLGTLRIAAAPVVDNELRLIGILSVTDVLSAAAELFETA